MNIYETCSIPYRLFVGAENLESAKSVDSLLDSYREDDEDINFPIFTNITIWYKESVLDDTGNEKEKLKIRDCRGIWDASLIYDMLDSLDSYKLSVGNKGDMKAIPFKQALDKTKAKIIRTQFEEGIEKGYELSLKRQFSEALRFRRGIWRNFDNFEEEDVFHMTQTQIGLDHLHVMEGIQAELKNIGTYLQMLAMKNTTGV